MLFADLTLLEVVSIEDNPDAISDHNILDLSIQEPDRILLKHPKTIKSKTANRAISILRGCKDKLPDKPKVIQDFIFNYADNINTTTGTILDYGDFAVQKQYMDYFNSRYKNCEYLYNPTSGAIAVYNHSEEHLDDILVGGIMVIKKFPKQSSI